MSLPKQNEAYIFYVTLASFADPSTFVTDPTIAAGDFKISVDGSALSNLDTLPVVDPAGSAFVRVDVSAIEMAGEKVNIIASDVSGDEWQELSASIDVPTGNIDSLYDLEVGDRIETSTRLIINEEGTANALLDKTITGSLLSPSVTLGTTDT